MSEYDKDTNITKGIEQLAGAMLNELDANAHKGKFSEWTPTREEFVSEIVYHYDKLIGALMDMTTSEESNPVSDARKLVTEYVGDAGNYLIKALTLFGAELPFYKEYHFRRANPCFYRNEPGFIENQRATAAVIEPPTVTPCNFIPPGRTCEICGAEGSRGGHFTDCPAYVKAEGE